MASVDEIEKDLALLLSTGEFSDVTFLVEGQELLAHRSLLAFRSKYFRALLFGDLAESQQAKIKLDVKVKPFKLILRYIYTGSVELEQLDDEDIMDLLGLVHEYEMEKLLSAVVNILKGKLSLETCYWLFNAAVKYDLEELLESCRIFLKTNAKTFVKHPSFNKLTESALKLFMKSNFDIAEIDIFMAAKSWCEQFPKIDPKSILANVKYSRISIQDILQKVKPTGLVDAEVLLQAIEAQFDESSNPRMDAEVLQHAIEAQFDESSNPRMDAEVLQHAIEAQFDESSNTIGHSQCILNETLKCRELPQIKYENCIGFNGPYIICCIEFHTPLPINCPLKISSNGAQWTYITDDIGERTEKRILFKQVLPSRFLYVPDEFKHILSIRGVPGFPNTIDVFGNWITV